MFKPSESALSVRLAALTGLAAALLLAFSLQPLGARAGVKAGAIGAAAEEAPALARANAPASSAKPAPVARPAGPQGSAQYRLRCWQHGRLLFDEGPVSLGADARLGAKMVATDSNGAQLLVTEAGGTTCLARPETTVSGAQPAR